MKSILATSFGIGVALASLSAPAHAQYESFRPPLGYYVNYECASLEGRGNVEVQLQSDQGGLALQAGPGLVPGQSNLMARSRILDVPAVFDENDQTLTAWEYEFTINNAGDDTQPVYAVKLQDQWATDDAESLKVYEYLPTPNGRPRSPGVFEYSCQVVGGGVNPFL